MSTVAERMEADAFAWLGAQQDVQIIRDGQWELYLSFPGKTKHYFGDSLADVVCDAHEELYLSKLRKQLRDSEE